MVLWWIVALNLGLAATQIVIGTSVRSLALVSDGAHTLSDALAAYVAWLAEAVRERPADEALPFGYARATTVGALVNVAALEALCVSIGLSALCRLWRPEPVADLRALAFASALGVAVNGLAAGLALCGVRGAHAHLGGRATRGYAPAADDDCACCVELEEAKGSDGDGGLGAGLVEAPKVGVGRAALVAHLAGDAFSCLCVFGEALFLRYGAPRLCSARRAALWRLYLDPCVSLVLAASIGRAAWPVGRRAAWNLLDGAPAGAAELRAKLAAIDGVECVEAAALLRLSDAPRVTAGFARLALRTRDGDGAAAAAARRVLRSFGVDEHAFVDVSLAKRLEPGFGWATPTRPRAGDPALC